MHAGFGATRYVGATGLQGSTTWVARHAPTQTCLSSFRPSAASPRVRHSVGCSTSYLLTPWQRCIACSSKLVLRICARVASLSLCCESELVLRVCARVASLCLCREREGLSVYFGILNTSFPPISNVRLDACENARGTYTWAVLYRFSSWHRPIQIRQVALAAS
jgi:hypothetical protein